MNRMHKLDEHIRLIKLDGDTSIEEVKDHLMDGNFRLSNGEFRISNLPMGVIEMEDGKRFFADSINTLTPNANFRKREFFLCKNWHSHGDFRIIPAGEIDRPIWVYRQVFKNGYRPHEYPILIQKLDGFLSRPISEILSTSNVRGYDDVITALKDAVIAVFFE